MRNIRNVLLRNARPYQPMRTSWAKGSAQNINRERYAVYSQDGEYSMKPIRYLTFFALALIIPWTFTLAIIGCYQTAIGTHDIPVPQHMLRFRLFLYWTFVPLATCINSVVEFHKLRQYNLTPLRHVVSASVSITLWLIAYGLWVNCMFYTLDLKPEGYSCPYGPGGYKWRPYDASQTRRHIFFVMPKFPVPSVGLYIFYLLLGVILLHRERRLRGFDEFGSGEPQMSTRPRSVDSYELERPESYEMQSPASSMEIQ